MSSLALAERLVAAVPASLPGLFNPWLDSCLDDTPLNDAESRIGRLAAHLDCDPEFICVGEAAGWIGMKRAAIAFTSERLLLEGAIPRVPAPAGRLSTRRLPYSEPSATIVWKTLKLLGIAERTLLWNALPMHPFKPGAADSNRTPTDAELMQGAPAMRLLVEAFPRAKVVAIGRKSELLLGQMGIATAGQVRHPANGGATAFSVGMKALAIKKEFARVGD
jgi:uracil-DNA glycosylase